MASKGLQLRIAGIPVRFDLSFFIIVGLLGLGDDLRFTATFVLIAAVSILLHEMGHAVAFRHYGASPTITLMGFGGLTTGPGNLGPRKDIVVSLAGPLSQLVLLGLPAWWLWSNSVSPSADVETLLGQLLWINIGWPVLNLAPILPLDGGHVTASVIDLVRPGAGRRSAQVVSITVALGVMVWAGRTGWVFLALLAAFFLVQNVMALSRGRAESADLECENAWSALVAHDGRRAQVHAEAALAQRPKGEQARWAAELLAWSQLALGDVPGAWSAVANTTPGDPAGQPSAALQGALSLASGRVNEGVALLAWSIAHDPVQRARILAAIAAAQSNQVPAVVSELRLLGPEAPQALVLFSGLLGHAGYTTEAGWVTTS
jgi:Zn-dependent protease